MLILSGRPIYDLTWRERYVLLVDYEVRCEHELADSGWILMALSSPQLSSLCPHRINLDLTK